MGYHFLFFAYFLTPCLGQALTFAQNDLLQGLPEASNVWNSRSLMTVPEQGAIDHENAYMDSAACVYCCTYNQWPAMIWAVVVFMLRNHSILHQACRMAITRKTEVEGIL